MDKLVITEYSNIVALADAVRIKTGRTDGLTMAEIIEGSMSNSSSGDGSTGGLDTSDATATTSHILYPYTAYAKGVKVTGGIQSRGAQTITPNSNTQEIPSGVYLSGKQTINPVPTQEKTVTSNGVVTPDSGKYLSKVTVNVPSEEPRLQNKSVNVTQNGTQTVSADSSYDGLGIVTINTNVQASGITIPNTISAGDTPVLISSTQTYTGTSTSMTNTGISITIPRAGTYRFKFSCGRTNTSGTWTAQLYKNGSAISDATATWNQYQGSYNKDVTCAAGDTITIYARSRGSSYRIIVGQLVACIDWDTGF